jgi:hypothetical protein
MDLGTALHTAPSQLDLVALGQHADAHRSHARVPVATTGGALVVSWSISSRAEVRASKRLRRCSSDDISGLRSYKLSAKPTWWQ